jgi:hypothetical protein
VFIDKQLNKLTSETMRAEVSDAISSDVQSKLISGLETMTSLLRSRWVIAYFDVGCLPIMGEKTSDASAM